MVENTMDLQVLVGKQLEETEPDVLRQLLAEVIGRVMSTEADAACNAVYGERSQDRMNSRNGYRGRRFDTRVGTIDLKIPKLRTGSYFPEWLLEPRRRAEKAFIAVIADCYLAGVSTRRVDKARQDTRDRWDLIPAGLQARQGARFRGRVVPQPTPRWRPLHLRVVRRPHREGQRAPLGVGLGRQGDRRQQRRLP